MKKTYSEPKHFINGLKWKTLQDQLTELTVMVLDCFQFKFAKPLDKQTQYNLLNFISELELNDKDILRVCDWLKRNEIQFKLSFQYDTNKSLRYNVRKFKIYRFFSKILKDIDEVEKKGGATSDDT